MKPKASSITRMADREFSRQVKERDGWTCRACGEPGTDCAHLVPRRFRRVRWDLRNAVTLCRRCHAHFTARPFAWDEWISEHIGAEVYRELRRTAEDGQKVDAKAVLMELRARRAS